MNYITMILQHLMFMAIMLVMAIIFHEAGHLFFLKKYNKGRETRLSWDRKTRSIRCGIESDYENLTTKQYKTVIWGGILAGALPIILYMVNSPLTFVSSPPLVWAYMRGCKTDIRIWKRIRTND